MKQSVIATQMCHECGATFDLKYSNEFGCGSYSFATEPCECEGADSSPIEGQPSISELIDSLNENNMYKKLMQHIGHNVVVVRYGNDDTTADVCVECEDCGCVIISAEDYCE